MNVKQALVLSGGGAKGAYETGCIRALQELNCDFDNRLIYDEDNFSIRRMNCQ